MLHSATPAIRMMPRPRSLRGDIAPDSNPIAQASFGAMTWWLYFSDLGTEHWKPGEAATIQGRVLKNAKDYPAAAAGVIAPPLLALVLFNALFGGR